jgi:hypothetical protein
MKQPDEDIADPILYRLYWGFILPDIAHKFGLDATPYVKQRLHTIHKKALGYDSIAGKSQGVVSKFLFEVCAEYAIIGIFVRTKESQPIGIELKGFTDIIEVNGEKKRVWDLL